MKKKLIYSIGGLIILFLAGLIYFASAVLIEEPKPDDLSILEMQPVEVTPGLFKIHNNWFRQSESSLYEMYVEGPPFERGVANGKLAEDLVVQQEVNFIDQIKLMVPSRAYLSFLKYLVAWFNRELPEHVTSEYQLEIYGVSRSASDEFDFIGPKYQRMLNYHAAHDIGHALQDRNFTVGCTSFAAWNGMTADSSLIVGRNFDFYSGDAFAKDKIVCFTNPDKGYKFMYITWGGMIGAVSGMNEKGLTVTINASKSDVPTGSATPISLLAREILQYAANIEEAYSIAESRQTFVSESILIGSASENKASIIEKSPSKIGLYQVDGDYLIGPNHYLSDTFKNDSLNIRNIRESSSQSRYERMTELINEHPKLDYHDAAEILRDRYGKGGNVIGNGNEKAINQLLAHHSVIFKPQERLVWVSTGPYQIGTYVCYDLKKVFETYQNLSQDREINIDSLEIPADDFIYSEEYEDYEFFRKTRRELAQKKYKLTQEKEERFINSNPLFYLTYYSLGDYYYKNNDYNAAKLYYNIALTKVITTKPEETYLREQIMSCEEFLLKKQK